MNQFIFKNRWFAAGFVALILFGTYLLVGDREGGLLSQMTNGVAERRTDLDTQLAEVSAPPPVLTAPQDDSTSEEHEYLEDEELIDSATGIDPTPPDEMAQGDGNTDPVADEAPAQANPGQSRVIEYVNGIAVIQREP